MSTLDIEIEVMKWFDIRRNLIVSNVHWGISYNHNLLHECDILSLSKSGYATEIEIKISKSDLLKDKNKPHKHDHPLIANLYFAVPAKLKELALSEIPERAGLILVESKYNKYLGKDFMHIHVVRSPIRNKGCIKWDDVLIMKLARLGTLRILGLKQKIQKLKLIKTHD